MVPERFFVSRWGAAASILCLLLLVAVGGWFYRAEAISAEEKARQQLSVLAHTMARQLVGEQQQIILDGTRLCNDTFFVDMVADFLEDRRNEDGVLSHLQSLREQGPYTAILVVDAAGAIRLHLGQEISTSLPLHRLVAHALADFHPVLVEPRAAVADEPNMVGVVAPIIRADHRSEQASGAVVLLRAADQFYGALFGHRQDNSESPQTLLVHRQEQDVLLVQNSPTKDMPELRRQPLQNVPPGSLVSLAISDRAGLVRGLDPWGEESLGFIVHVPEIGSWLIEAEPEARVFNLWRYRAAVLLFIFAGVVGLASYLWQFSRKEHYKTLYDCEARLRRNLEYQTILLQAIGDGVIATDRTGMVEFINPAAEYLTGWNRDEALGRPLGEVFSVVSGSGEKAEFVLSNNKEPENIPVVEDSALLLITRDGNERTVAALTAPVWNGTEEFVGTVLIFHDRSEEHQNRQWVETRLLLREYAYAHGVEELLHRAMQELSSLLESPQGFCCGLEAPHWAVAVKKSAGKGSANPWIWVEKGCKQTCKGVDRWLTEIPGEAMINDPTLQGEGQTDVGICAFGTVREILFPVQRAGKRVALLAVADKPRPYSSRDLATMNQMGEYIWRLIEQKQMKEDLLASERRYRTLYRSMMDAFVVTDLQGRIRECNQAYAAMLGFTPEEITSRFASDFTPKQWLEYEQEHVRKQLMHTGCSELYEKEYRHRDGTVFPVELRTFLLVNNEGQPEGVSAVVRDISHRKQSEKERDKLRDRLNQAQRLESIGQLAGGVAHDFNNMLSVIIGYAELALRQKGLTNPLNKYLHEIAKAGKRSAGITRQLLAFARRQNIVPKLLDLNVTLEGMLKMLRRLIGEDVELIWLPGRDIWPVRMDPSQIDQLLANLCVNARDAISNVGKITIETGRVTFDEAYCREREGFIPGDFVLLAVSDNGSGIDRDILDKIFEPFFTTKAIGQGTGLGLATVYGIVKQNNGFINVYSEAGHGTTFRIYLPRQEGEAELARPEDMQPLPFGNGEIILVVEDEASMLALNKTMIEQLNYTVLAAATPSEALELAREHTKGIDLVLTDVIMPEMNGRDLVRAIGEYCPNAKTLFMSGYTANVIAHRGELEEDVHFIPKPYSTGELARAIQAALHATHLAD